MKTLNMQLEHIIRILAGVFVLVSIVLGHFAQPAWLLLGVFVGVNLIQSAFTGFCPAEKILIRMGLGSGGCCDSRCKRQGKTP